MGQGVTFAQQHRRAADRPRLARRRVAGLGRSPPRHAAHGAKLVQHGGHVVVDARGQQVLFPGRGRRRMAFELPQHVGQPAFAFAALVAIAVGQLVPAEQEAHELRRRHRLELGAQLVARAAVDAREQAPVAPFGRTGGGEGAAHHRAFGFELQQGGQHGIAAQAQRRAQCLGSDRAEQLQAAAQDLAQRFVGRGPLGARPALWRATALRPGTPPATHAGALPRRQSVARPPPAAVRLTRRCCASASANSGHGASSTGEEAVHHQRIVQLVGVADLGPGVLAHLRDRLRIEPAEVLRRLQVHQRLAC